MDFKPETAEIQFDGNGHTQGLTFCWVSYCGGGGHLQVEKTPLVGVNPKRIMGPQQIPREGEESEGAQPTLLSSPPLLGC